MTRINLIHPSELCDKHLMACYRELIRIPNVVHQGKMQTYYPGAPKVYTLGAGHCVFFVNKLQFCTNGIKSYIMNYFTESST